MKTFFPNKRRILLIGGVINLLILAIMVLAVTGPSLGTHAQMALTLQDPFSVFCYFYYHDGKDSNADSDTANCTKQSITFLSILKQETSPDNYEKWPRQASLDNLAMAGLLINPQTQTSIKKQQDFQAAIPAADQDLLALFQKDSQFLPNLWNYNSTYDNISLCGTATTKSKLPANACLNQTNQPPTCPVNPQSFQHSDIWPVVGPTLLATISQELQDQNGQHIGIYDIYGRLLLQDHCSVATLAQTLKRKGQPIQLNQAYQLEQDALVQVAIANSSNTQLLLALVSAASQTNNQQLDSWFSAAIITDPINPSVPPPASTQPSTSTLTPSTQTTPSSQSSPGVSVGSGPPSTGQVKIGEKNGNYSFDPPIVMITKGTKVVWTNSSDDSHTVTSDTNAFTASASLAQNQTFEMVFNTVGTFAYHCAKHPYMKAIVVVTS